MSINSVSTSIQNPISNTSATFTTDNTISSTTTQLPTRGEAAVYERSDPKAVSSKTTYTRDTLTVDEITKQVDMKFASLRSTVETLFNMQNVKSSEGKGLSYDEIMEKYDGKLNDFYQNLKVDDTTRLNAQQDISEDGFWGVAQTSERAIHFAKALVGNDPSKVALLKKSIEDGYKAAEKSWGGQLPEISKQTQEAILKGLDDWANQANQSTPIAQAMKTTQAS